MTTRPLTQPIRLAALLGLALFLLLAPTLAAARPQQTAVPTPATAVPRILHSGADGLTFELRTPPLSISVDGAVTVPGLSSLGQAGQPDLPVYRALIAVPPGATVSAVVTAGDESAQTVAAVAPAPRHVLHGAAATADDLFPTDPATLQETTVAAPLDTAVYQRDAIFPAARHTLSAPQIARDLRVVQLELYPVRYNPAQGALTQAQTLRVALTFAGATLNPDPAPATGAAAWAGLVLNPPPASWRLGPQTAEDAAQTAVTLPTDRDVYKIEVNADGIYQISGADLAAAGLNLAATNPATLQLMHRGQPVAFQLIRAGGGGSLQSGDLLRFYGWAFDGSRAEDMYVDRNIYWLWAGGTPLSIQGVGNSGGGFQPVTSFRDTVTTWPHNSFFSGWGIDWEDSPNDATSWHMDRLNNISQATGVKKSYPISLPNPDPAGPAARVTAEFTSRLSPISATATQTHTYKGALALNKNAVAGGTVTWKDQGNVNAAGNAPAGQLLAPGAAGYPQNQIEVTLGGAVAGDTNQQVKLDVYVTRLSVAYQRRLVAAADELQFGLPQAGKFEYQVSGFGESNPAQILVWDISDRLQPRAISLSAADIAGGGGDYTLKIRREQGANGRYIATTAANLRQPLALSQYTPGPLSPPDGAAWVAITHKSLRPAADRLAQARAANSGFDTWVVDIEDVVNQSFFGYHTPQAIRAYLKAALATWPVPPDYVTLFGDATLNPRNLACPVKCADKWDPNKPNLVVTDLLFIDRFNGLVPVDFSMSLLRGDDLLPDIHIGRIPAETLKEAQDIVDKILIFEQNAAQDDAIHNHFLFVADNADGGGNFCAANAGVVDQLPGTIKTTQLCLPEDTEEATNALRREMFKQINDAGLSLLNYRGHGNVTFWAAPKILDSTADADLWQNVNRPVAILSADCLDGYFVAPYNDGLGESVIGLGNRRGSVAHWSSSGLGYTFEHTALVGGFYDATFRRFLLPIGAAVTYAKVTYLAQGYHPSEAYSFILLGDPAMPTGSWTPSAKIPVVLAP